MSFSPNGVKYEKMYFKFSLGGLSEALLPAQDALSLPAASTLSWLPGAHHQYSSADALLRYSRAGAWPSYGHDGRLRNTKKYPDFSGYFKFSELT